ncbi:hypothetical protein AA313_de0202469 [Arthrobotrys entomopaga]|nr:hypothetical protein AA313_de0202469 [Arthrobotrys entomopaga]
MAQKRERKDNPQKVLPIRSAIELLGGGNFKLGKETLLSPDPANRQILKVKVPKMIQPWGSSKMIPNPLVDCNITGISASVQLTKPRTIDGHMWEKDSTLRWMIRYDYDPEKGLHINAKFDGSSHGQVAYALVSKFAGKTPEAQYQAFIDNLKAINDSAAYGGAKESNATEEQAAPLRYISICNYFITHAESGGYPEDL